MTEREKEWYRTEFGYFRNSGLNGQPLGYTCKGPVRFEKRYWLLPAVGLYDFQLNVHRPLTLIAGNRFLLIGILPGTEIQPSKRYETDKGSIPSFAQGFYSKDRFLGVYYHDSGYEWGYLFIRAPGEDLWHKHYMSRYEVDKLLELAIGADPCPGNAVDRGTFFNAVHLVGWTCWDPEGKAFRRQRRKDESKVRTPFPPPDTHAM